MTTIADVRDALAECCSTVPELTGFAYLADTIVNQPAAHVAMPAYDPRLVLSKAKTVYQFRIELYSGRQLDRQAQVLMDGFREPSGSTSVVAAVENEDNWAVTVDYASVTQVGEVRPVQIGGVDYLGVTFDVEVCW